MAEIFAHTEAPKREEPVRHPTWFSRWRSYPWSVLGHITQGFVAGATAGTGSPQGITLAAVWFGGFVAYQGLSFARKVNLEGRGDTAGLDAFDFVVGFVPGWIIGFVGTAIHRRCFLC